MKKIEKKIINFFLTKVKPAEYKNVKISGKLLRKTTKSAAKDLRKHFDKHGWDLDARSIIDDVLYDAIGFHIGELILRELVTTANVGWGRRDNSFSEGMYPSFYDDNTTPIFYDNVSNRITTKCPNHEYMIELGPL